MGGQFVYNDSVEVQTCFFYADFSKLRLRGVTLIKNIQEFILNKD